MEIVSLEMEDVVTVFAQGNHASRTQACKYAGPKGFDIRVTNGNIEHVFNPESPTLLHNIYTYGEFNDLEYGVSYNPVHWLSKLVHLGVNNYYNVYGTSCLPHNLLTSDNIAGPEDVAQYVNAVRACIKENPKKKVVLFGCSRGASIVLVALTKFTETDLSHIHLAIAEAPFATVPSVLSHTYPAPMVPWMLSALEKFTNYDSRQLSPLEAVKSSTFPLGLPLLFVTSKVDTTVPPEETQMLIDILRDERGHRELHHLELLKSHHCEMSLQDEDDVDLYLKKLKSLYRHYKL